MSRAALIIALAACVIAGAALAVALTRKPPAAANPWPLVCQEQFSSQGQQIPVYYPCAQERPRP